MEPIIDFLRTLVKEFLQGLFRKALVSSWVICFNVPLPVLGIFA